LSLFIFRSVSLPGTSSTGLFFRTAFLLFWSGGGLSWRIRGLVTSLAVQTCRLPEFCCVRGSGFPFLNTPFPLLDSPEFYVPFWWCLGSSFLDEFTPGSLDNCVPSLFGTFVAGFLAKPLPFSYVCPSGRFIFNLIPLLFLIMLG